VNFLTQARIASEKLQLKIIWKCLSFTNCWSKLHGYCNLTFDIPYSAFSITIANNKPKFDKQSEVYSQLQILLDNAITNLTKAGSIPAGLDIYYQGDVTKWTQLAYSFKARYYLHVKIYL
jgi:hypothetical protein